MEYLFSQKPLQFVPVDCLLILLRVSLLHEVIIRPVGGGLLVLLEEVGAVKHQVTVTAPVVITLYRGHHHHHHHHHNHR